MFLFILLLVVLLGFAGFVASVALYSREPWVFTIGLFKWGATFKAYPHEVILICVAASSIITALFAAVFSTRRGKAEVEELRRHRREAEERVKQLEGKVEEYARRISELEHEMERFKSAEEEVKGEG